MSKASPALTNFNTGEFSPMLDGRVDFDKYPNGASKLENFIPTTQGPIVRRAGTRYVAHAYDFNHKSLLVTFEYSVDQAYILEFSNFTVRFFTWDAVTKVRGIVESSPGVPYVLTTPYSAASLYNSDGTPRLKYVQSGDFLYLAHSDHVPQILKRLSATTFEISPFQWTGGPWQPTVVGYAELTSSGETGNVTISASQDIFLPGHVGSYLMIEQNDISLIKAWEVGKTVTQFERRKSDGKSYWAGIAGTTGSLRPVHTVGAEYDGDDGVQWYYADPGYGYVYITEVNSPRSINATVIERLPVSQVISGGSGPVVLDITGIGRSALSNIASIETSAPHNLSVGGKTTIRIADGQNYLKSQLNGIRTVTGISSANVFQVESEEAGTLNQSGALGTCVSGTVFPTPGNDYVVQSTRYAFCEWSNEYGWPSVVAFHRERLWWARGQNVWASVSADFTDYSPKNFGEVTPDMAINITMASGKINDVQWLASDRDLVAGTAGAEFTIGDLDSGQPIGPGNVTVKLASEFGSRNISPIKNGESVLFVERSGLAARETSYDFAADGYKSSDTTVLAEHISRGGFQQMVFSAAPDQVVWFTRADGKLIGFTWNNEQNVRGWHLHNIGGGGVVESIATMPAAEGDHSELWMLVRRTINGQDRRYIEYLERPYRRGDSVYDVFYVDSGLTYKGADVTTLSGLDHLEGATVSVLANGAPHPDVVVTGGSITLQYPTHDAQVGFGCPAIYRSMRLEAGARDGTAQGKTKRIHKVVYRMMDTGGGQYGTGENNAQWDYFLNRTPNNLMDQHVPFFNGDKVVTWNQGYTTDAYVGIRIDQPTALTMVGIYPQIVTQDAR